MDASPGTSGPEGRGRTGPDPTWYTRDNGGSDDTLLSGTSAIHSLKLRGLKPYLIYAILNPNSVTSHYSEGGAWQDLASNAPDDDLLRVAPRSPEQLREHCIPIGYAKRAEECENFGRISNTIQGQPAANGHPSTTHTLGETCVVVWSTSRKEATMLCGFGNFNNRWNRPGGISEEDWSKATGVQPNRFRLRTLNAEAAHIGREERVFSDSNRVLGYVGNNPPRHQFDPDIDNVETRERAALAQPVEITARRFPREEGRGTQGTLGFAVLDLFDNNVAIMRYLEAHWDQLSTTSTPFAPHQRQTQMWILADRDANGPVWHGQTP